ncbi:GNAT family N-acetyltransferase [Paenibacillus protaetiae]|uniref:GNAT family N-acetyltransferase n=2 Tax=Paenibacillus protaetiae TaxID=2509456 RepID=A0A4P6F1F0_9BACL|nr:GNAT family N-acetyltransferase [Paenibacillus protaetiae]
MELKHVEELALNQWPALSALLYDGWLLRFAEGYTKRSNSVSPIFGSSLDTAAKIAACEELYASQQQPAIFKITPFVQPEGLDQQLAERGYVRVDSSFIQTLSLDQLQQPRLGGAVIRETLTANWLVDFCRLNPGSAAHRSVMEQIITRIIGKTGFISLVQDGRTVACGFGVIERGCIGLYDIVTDEACRNKGYAEQMITHLLHWGKSNGAASSYLAVIAQNKPALRLYEKLGYKTAYEYWYRVRPN